MITLKPHNLGGIVVVAFTLLVTLGRGLRLPNEFAMSHWLFDYRFGFMKRGLVGSVCAFGASLFGGSVSALGVNVLSGLLMLAFVALLLFILFEAMRPFRDDSGRLPLLLIAVSSPFIVLNAHLIGYFDGLIYLLAALAIALQVSNRALSSGLVSAAAVLTHESYVVVGLPLVVLAAYQSERERDRPLPNRRHALALVPPLLAFALVSAAVEWGDISQLRERWSERLATIDFVSHKGPRTAELNTTAFSQFWNSDFRLVGRRLVDSVVLGPGFPSLVTLLLMAHRGYGVRPLSPLSLLILFSVLSPLLLHTLAWDSARISAYPIGGALFVLWILARTRTAVRPGPILSFLALPVLLVNAFGRTPLMDGETDRFSDPLRLLLYAPAALLTLSALLDARRPGRPSLDRRTDP